MGPYLYGFSQGMADRLAGRYNPPRAIDYNGNLFVKGYRNGHRNCYVVITVFLLAGAVFVIPQILDVLR